MTPPITEALEPRLFLDAIAAVEPPGVWGDANTDYVVDLDDFVILKQNFGTQTGATWSDGDFDGDGAVNLRDFDLLEGWFTFNTQLLGPTLALPEITSAAWAWQDYSDQPLVSGITASDIDQGGVGDCYFLAPLAAFANADANLIRQVIAPVGDGTYVVRMFDASGTRLNLHIDGQLPITYQRTMAYAELGEGNDIWASLLEKAFTYIRKGANTYASIAQGWPAEAYVALLGVTPTTKWISSMGDAAMLDWLSSGVATLGSKSDPTGPVVARHVYAVLGVEGEMVTVYNPWGWDGTYIDANHRDGVLVLSVEQIRAGFLIATVNA